MAYTKGTSNGYIWSDYANNLKSGSWNDTANWTIHHMPDGEVMFRNTYYNGSKNRYDLCLSTYGRNWQVTSSVCDTGDNKQRFKLLPTQSGATLVKNSVYGCLYTHSGTENYLIYSDTCPSTSQSREVPSKWLWSLIPPLKASKPMVCGKGQLSCKN